MPPIIWLLIAEIPFFLIGLANIIQGIILAIDPTYQVSFFLIFAMFVVWFLDKVISYIIVTNNITADDLMGRK